MTRRLLPLLLLSAISGFASTAVQFGPNNCRVTNGSPGTGPLTCTFTNPPTAGNILVVGVHVRVFGATSVTSVADTLLTPFTQKSVSATWGTAGSGVAIWTGVASGTGSDTVTVTLNGSYYFLHVTLAEYPAADVLATTSGTVSNFGSSTTNMGCGTFTPTSNNVQVIAAIFDNGQNTTAVTAKSPMTNRITSFDATLRKAVLQDYFMATAASITPGIDDTASPTATGYSCAAIALSPVGTPARRKQAIYSLTRGGVDIQLPDWSMVWFSDQHPSAAGVPWVANSAYALSKEAAWNTKAYLFTGDYQAFGETGAGFATHGWNAVIATGKPTLSAPGNHDCNAEDCTLRATSQYDTSVGYSKVSSASYGPVVAFTGTGDDLGVYPDATYGSQANYAIRFVVNTHKFLVIALELFPRTEVMTWAANLAALYPSHQVIWVTHAYQIDGTVGRPCVATDVYCAGSGGGYNNFTTTGQILYDTLIKVQPNSFLTLSGHFIGRTPHYSQYLSAGTSGQKIVGLMANFQELLPTGDNDRVMRLVFHESTGLMDLVIMRQSTDQVDVSYLGMPWL